MLCLCRLLASDVQAYFAVIVILTTVVYWMLFLKSSPYALKQRSDNEKHFINEQGTRMPFPSLEDESSVELSIIVPAYNEQDRIRPMLDSCFHYMIGLGEKCPFEVIVVSDGSTDRTCDIVMEYVQKYGSEQIRLLKLDKNRGKGGAVCLGMKCARGNNLLFADADGATSFQDLQKLYSALHFISTKAESTTDKNVSCINLQAVVCGSRAHLETESKAHRSVFRTFLMMCFHIHVWLFGVRTIKDTQCGFKLLTRTAGRILFNNLHVDGWAFDVEMLYIAEKLKMNLVEVPVNWTEIEGSKIVPVWSWLEMGFDVFAIWFKYRTGSWKIRDVKIN